MLFEIRTEEKVWDGEEEEGSCGVNKKKRGGGDESLHLLYFK